MENVWVVPEMIICTFAICIAIYGITCIVYILWIIGWADVLFCFPARDLSGAKKQLLHKLRRFEKLAELDPIELEKRILEQEQDYNENDTYDLEQEEEFENYEPTSPDGEKEVDEFVKEVLSKSNFYHVRRIPEDMKRLVADLIAEEEQEQSWSNDKEAVVKRVCRRLESWKEVESNTIDMMVEHDLGREHDGWRRRQELVGDTALEIEFGIFGLLMEELSEELVV